MKLIINSMTLTNFKGIQNRNIQFGLDTKISGANATGKSTIYDAFCWLILGKDAQGRADFNIKTLDKNGNVIPELIHTVTAQLTLTDDNENTTQLTLKRELREKYIQLDSAQLKTFQGNETHLYWNDVEIKLAEYNQRINSLCNTETFNYITNPANLLRQPEATQRAFLYKLIGNVNIDDILQDAQNPERTKQMLNDKGTVSNDEFLRAQKRKLQKLNSDLKDCNLIIEEKERDLTHITINSDETETQLTQQSEENRQAIHNLQAELAKIKQLPTLNDILLPLQQQLETVHKQQLARRNQLHEYLFGDYYKRQSEFQQLQIQLKTTVQNKELLQARVQQAEKDCQTTENELETLRKDYLLLAKQTFPEVTTPIICPTCQQPLNETNTQAKINELQTKWQDKHNRDLQTLAERGNLVKKQYDSLCKQLQELETQLAQTKQQESELCDRIQDFPPFTQPDESQLNIAIENDINYQELQQKADQLQQQINSELALNGDYQAQLTERQAQLQAQLDTLVHKQEDIITNLTGHKARQLVLNRIQELETQANATLDNITQTEEYIQLIEEYTHLLASAVVVRINALFHYVQFKLFDKRNDGTLYEVCKATVNGVPYQDLNNAARINTHIAIADAIAKRTNTLLPIFIDNAEAVNQLLETDNQIVKLYVSDEKTLQVTF